MAFPAGSQEAELQKARADIEALEKDVKDAKAQIQAADQSFRLGLQQQLIAPLQEQLATLRKKEERLSAQLSAGATPQQESSSTRCCVQLLIKGRNNHWMRATALVDSGCTCALLLSEHKATQLGLQRDGSVSLASVAGASTLTIHGYDTVKVAVCVQDRSGQESHINERYLECWALDGASASSLTAQNAERSSIVLDTNLFSDFALTVTASSHLASSSTESSALAHETEAGVSWIPPARLGTDHDIVLGRPGMHHLQVGIDKVTGDMVCLLHSPDAVL